MSFKEPVVKFEGVWKRYSREDVFHRSIREDIMGAFRFNRRSKDIYKNEFWALQGVQFSVTKGETLGFYGPNGAGKSTILKLIAGVTYPTRGTISLNGRVAPLIEIGAGFHPDLTGQENIYMNGTILGMKIADIKKAMADIISFAELSDFIHMPVKKYSSGMHLRLAFAIAIHCDSSIYLIDEILAVGDEKFQQKCLKKIEEKKRQGKTLIIITHDKCLMNRVADRVLSIDQGRILEDVF